MQLHSIKSTYTPSSLKLSLYFVASIVACLFVLPLKIGGSFSLSPLFLLLAIRQSSQIRDYIWCGITYCILFVITDFSLLTLIDLLGISIISFIYLKKKSLMTLNAVIFQILISIPFMLLYFITVHELTKTEIILLTSSLSIVHILNILIIDFMDIYYSIFKMSIPHKISIYDIFYHLSYCFLIIPLAIILIMSNSYCKHHILHQVEQDFTSIMHKTKLEYLTVTLNNTTSKTVHNKLFILHRTLASSLNNSTSNINALILTDRTPPILFNQHIETLIPIKVPIYSNSLADKEKKLFLIKQKTRFNRQIASSWINAYFVYLKPIDQDLTLVLYAPTSEFLNILLDFYQKILVLLIPLWLCTLFFRHLIKKLVTKVLLKLGDTTKNLAQKVVNHQSISLEMSNISEIDNLITNFETTQIDIVNILRKLENKHIALKASEQQLFTLAHMDVLTHIPNRYYFMTYARKLLDDLKLTYSPEKAVFLFIDVDKFKYINDHFGHAIGDQVLFELAQKAKETLEHSSLKDSFLARLGGDEFIIMTTTLDLDTVDQFIVDLINKVSTPVCINSINIITSISVGISIFPDHGETLDLLLERSDKAMYHSKQSGGNSYHLFIPQNTY